MSIGVVNLYSSDMGMNNQILSVRKIDCLTSVVAKVPTPRMRKTGLGFPRIERIPGSECRPEELGQAKKVSFSQVVSTSEIASRSNDDYKIVSGVKEMIFDEQWRLLPS